ncbi:hypothetical protein [Paracoccus cavernae]|uniref:hypothetical protein n=1 Tax=Paracoccus cavernae TaxID=1571207 RepID=UPI003625D801
MAQDTTTRVQERLDGLRKLPPKPSPLKTYGPYAAALAVGLGIGGYVASIPSEAEQSLRCAPLMRRSFKRSWGCRASRRGFRARNRPRQSRPQIPRPRRLS